MLDCADLTLTHSDTDRDTHTYTNTHTHTLIHMYTHIQDTLSITCWRKQFFKLCDNHLQFNRIACSMWQLRRWQRQVELVHCCQVNLCILLPTQAGVCVCVCVLICVPFAQTEIENEISLQLRCLICLIGSPQLHI